MASNGRQFLRRNTPFLLAAALTALLLTLAFLQYRWLVQVSEAERQRAHAHVAGEAAAFARDFNESLSRLAFDFLPLFEAPQEEEALAEVLSGRLERWRGTSAEPALLGSLWVLEHVVTPAEDEEEGALKVLHLDEKARSLVTATLPPSFAELGKQLARFPGGERRPHPGHNGRHPPGDFGFDPLAEQIPALVLPLPDPPTDVSAFTPGRKAQDHQPPPRIPFWRAGGQRRFLVLELDRTALNEQILPQLVERHFPESGFGLQIVRKDDPGEVIFRAGATLPSQAKIETRVDLFGPLSFSRSIQPPPPPVEPLPPAAPVAPRARVAPVAPTAAVPTFEPTPPPLPSMAAPPAPDRGGPSPFFFARTDGPGSLALREGRWQLEVFHEAGSLDALIAGAQRRNLMVAFGILLVLGVSMLFLAHAARKAQELARRQMELVAGVSHELLTPLAAMKSAGQNLRDGVVQEGPKVSRYGELIVKESDRLSGLVGQVLLWAGLSSQDVPLHRESLNARDLAAAALEDLRPGLDAAEFAVELTIAENLPSFEGDPAALRQALGNLIANAIKYGKSAKGKNVLRLAAEVGEAGKTLIFSVGDQGRGIEAEDLPHLFEPFYRGRKVVASPIAGAGLGLALVRRIATAHGGDIRASSVPGRGTTFLLSLPLNEEPAS